MVYAGSIGTKKVSLGVSGRLKQRNLLMWDTETNSLWSQIKGEALYGKSKGAKLSMLPAIFVGLGTWRAMHPNTSVLDLSQVRQRSWFYTTKDLRRGSVRGRGGAQALGLGLRHGGATLAVTIDKIREDGVVNVAVGGKKLALVWVEKHSVPLVYERRAGAQKLARLVLESGRLRGGKRSFDPLTGAAADGKSGLRRFPYLPTYVSSWRTFYPKGAIMRKEG